MLFYNCLIICVSLPLYYEDFEDKAWFLLILVFSVLSLLLDIWSMQADVEGKQGRHLEWVLPEQLGENVHKEARNMGLGLWQEVRGAETGWESSTKR